MKKLLFLIIAFCLCVVKESRSEILDPANLQSFMVTYRCNDHETRKVYMIYEALDMDHSSGELTKHLKCMVLSPDLISYRNVVEGEVKESNGALFVSFIFYQMSGEFGIIYDDVFYKVAKPGEDNFSDLIENAHFNSSDMTVTYDNVMGEPRMIKLSEVPPENQIKLTPEWY